MGKYQKNHQEASKTDNLVSLTLDELVLLGAKRMLEAALSQEIDVHVGRKRYERRSTGEESLYRNGYGKERHLTVGCGTFPLRVPRLRDGFSSKIVQRYQRYSDQIGTLFPQLYMHGLATGDFESCFSQVLGEHTPLSASHIVRLKADWQNDYTRWKKRKLESEYLYVWVDGVYPKAGLKDEDMAILVVLGVKKDGTKELLAIEEGYRESYESWRDVFRNIKKRGVSWIGLVVADGLPGVWRALRDVFPRTKRQRCLLHKIRNVLDKVPVKVQPEIHEALKGIYHARSKTEAQACAKAFIRRYTHRYPKAVASLKEAGNMLFAYFEFPKEHWKSLKTTNPIESMFAAVKLRTNAAKRIVNRASALSLIFQLLITQQYKLKRIHGYKLVAQTIDARKNKKVRNAA